MDKNDREITAENMIGNVTEVVLPRPLVPGSQVCIIDPANAFTEEGIRGAKELLGGAGYRVVVSEDMAFKRGTADERVIRLNKVIRDPENSGILCLWGGYGTLPLLDGIDYEALRANRPVFSGFSDITAMHAAIFKRAGLVTFHGPALYSTKRPVTSGAYEYFLDLLAHPGRRRVLKNLNGEEFRVIRGGRCRGRLTGGNMTLVSRLMGTPYEIDARGRILFLEEVGEKPYRLHGMLYQLKLSGKLDEAAGIMIGGLTDCDDKDRPGSALNMVGSVLSDLDIPVVCGVRAGHLCDPLTLPLGACVTIDDGEITIQEDKE